MKMSTKGRYGLRVMLELASHFGRGPLSVGAIATRQKISAKYIHVLASGLRSAGLVRAVRGPSGGYELARSPTRITALDVVATLEGKRAPVECVGDAETCPQADRCVTRDLWCDVAAAVDRVLAGVTLAQLASRQQARLGEPINYQI